MVHLQQPAESKLCGQTCVAMAAGISIEDAILSVGHRHATRLPELLKAFREFGISRVGTKRTCWNGRSAPPRFSLLSMLFHKPGEKHHGHWLLNWDGVIHDPSCSYAGVHSSGGRFSSLIELVPPETGK